MPTVPIKLDTSCTKVFTLSGGACVGHGLSTINYNLTSLDTATCNISYSGDNLWTPWHTTVASSSGDWNSTYTTIASFSGNWESSRVTVNSLSSFWLSPITIVYPESIYLAGATSNVNKVTAWIVANFPVANYKENQKFYVYTFEWAQKSNSNSEVVEFLVSPQDSSFTMKCRADCIENGNCETKSASIEGCWSANWWLEANPNPSYPLCDCSAGMRHTHSLPCGDDESDTAGRTLVECEQVTRQSDIEIEWDDIYTKRIYGIEMQIQSGAWVHTKNLNTVSDCN